MQLKTYDIDLNVREKKFIRSNAVINQGDNRTTVFNIRILDGVDEIIYSNIFKAVIVFLKSDKTTSEAELTRVSDGYSYTLTSNDVASAGDVLAGVMLYGADGERLTTCYFVFGVIDDLISPDKLISSNEFDSLWEAMKLLEQVQKMFEEFPNLPVLGSFKNLTDLKAAYPDGSNLGGGFFIEPEYYFWSKTDNAWTSAGRFKGDRGAMQFNLSAATSTAPAGARVEDIVQNVGAATYVIGGLSMAIGDVGEITSLSPFTVVKEGNNRGVTGAQGIQGTIIFPVTTAITTAPTSPTAARVGDLILNGGTASLTIGGRALAIGDCAAITVLSPLALGAVAGNLRGAIGAQGIQGIQGIQGTLIFLLSAATSTAPAGSRVNDRVLNGGSTTYTIGGISMAIGDTAKITSLSPFTVVKDGNLRGPMGPATLPLIDNLTQATPGVGALDAAQGKILDEKKLDKAGGTISGNLLPDIANTRSLGSAALPFGGVFSSAVQMGNYAEGILGIRRTNTGIANEKFDILIPDASGGMMEIHISSNYDYQNASGIIIKRYALSSGVANIAFQRTRYTCVSLETGANYAISDLQYDSSKGKYVTVSKLNTLAGTTVLVFVKFFGSAVPNITNITLSPIYTTDTTIPAIPVVSLDKSPALGSNDLQPATTKFVQDTQAAFVEEGTWTPRIEGSVVAGVNVYSEQSGTYYKVGDLVTIQGAVALSQKDASMAGQIQIRGLPFPAKKGTYGQVLMSNVAFDPSAHITLMASGGVTYLLIRNSRSDGTVVQMNVDALRDISSFNVSITYQVW